MLTTVYVTAKGGAGDTTLATILGAREDKRPIVEPRGCHVGHGAYTIGRLSIVDPIGEGAAEIAKLARTFDEVANG